MTRDAATLMRCFPQVATAGDDRRLCLWSCMSGAAEQTWEDAHGKAVNRLAYTHEEGLLSSGAHRHRINRGFVAPLQVNLLLPPLLCILIILMSNLRHNARGYAVAHNMT